MVQYCQSFVTETLYIGVTSEEQSKHVWIVKKGMLYLAQRHIYVHVITVLLFPA
jgi:hypothetical protein